MTLRDAGLAALFFACLVGGAAGEALRVPADPPKSRYKIEAAISPENGTVSGSETVRLVNPGLLPMTRIALDWTVSKTRSVEVRVGGRRLEPLNPVGRERLAAPLLFDLPAPLAPKAELILQIDFSASDLLRGDGREYKLTGWHPRLWWNGMAGHDAFEVKVAAPPGYALAASGRLDQGTGTYKTDAAATFGLYLGRGMKAEEIAADGVLIRALFTEAGADCARLCLATAADTVRFYKKWLGFYPFPSLTVIPGGSDPWGGYPFATGIVVIHGQEKMASRNADFWQWITSHEVGHQYWGEYVLDADDPAWLWIGLGIFADREYTRAKGLSPDRHPGFFAQFLIGMEKRLDTTLDIPPAQETLIDWDRNKTVVEGKGFSVVSALDGVLGRETFHRVYARALREYGGRRLGWRDFRRLAEEESGLDLGWFFLAWVRSNTYPSYKITAQTCRPEGAGFVSEIRILSQGTMQMPVPVRAEFEDGTARTATTDRLSDLTVLRFESRSPLKTVALDPDRAFALRQDPIPMDAEELQSAVLFELPSTGAGEKALRLYEIARAQKIPDRNVWFRLGLVLFDGGYWPEAFQSFSTLAETTPETLERFAARAWMGMLKDLLGERDEALGHYREALRYDTGQTMRHDQFGILINKAWIEERLTAPFRWEK
ncbi:MAG: hypothetical protein NTZ26_07900 [Candidatus Aminicenantes bacterium]|nr:hypothetical protein [Candidatus Aminicenantes bacterium]